MTYYKDTNGGVHWLDAGSEIPASFPDGAVEITDAEADAIRAPTQVEIDAKRKEEILNRLDAIDIESIRALRAQKIGMGNQQDLNKLSTLEDEAVTLRIELNTLP